MRPAADQAADSKIARNWAGSGGNGLPFIEELSIGHAVISRAVMVGLDQAVREMLKIVRGM